MRDRSIRWQLFGSPGAQRFCTLRTLCIATALSAHSLLADAAGPPSPCSLDGGPRHTVTRVIDGETLLLDDGSEVRLIGALTARAPVHAPQEAPWPPAEAARRLLEELAFGRSVRLIAPETRLDRYGRRLAQVVVDGDAGPIWLQARLVEEGLARVYSSPQQRECVAELTEREVVARAADRGLWSMAAYRVRPATAAAEIARFRHTFQIVEGVVHDVAHVRDETFVNFGSDYRADFALVIAGRDRRALEAAGIAFNSLSGSRLRVRGGFETRLGPMLRLNHASQIELLEPSPDAANARPVRAPRKKRPASTSPDAQ